MKKVLFGMLIAAFGAGAVAQSIVYEYKASIKKLDAKYKKSSYKYNGSSLSGILVSYDDVSDTLEGYLQLAACNACGGDMDASADVEGNEATIWVKRKGDKYSSKSGVFVYADGTSLKYYTADRTWYKVPAEVGIAIYGDCVDVLNDKVLDEKHVSAKKAEMGLDYEIMDEDEDDEELGIFGKDGQTGEPKIDPTVIDKKFPGATVVDKEVNAPLYGVLGLDNFGSVYVRHTGFGSVKSFNTADVPGSWCGSEGEKGVSCKRVDSIDGTLVGYCSMQGMCGLTPIWDMCSDEGVSGVNGVICGTWSLKYNDKLTKAGSDAAQVDAIEAAMDKKK